MFTNYSFDNLEIFFVHDTINFSNNCLQTHQFTCVYKQQNIPENDVMALDATGLLAFEFNAHPQLSSSLPENMGQ